MVRTRRSFDCLIEIEEMYLQRHCDALDTDVKLQDDSLNSAEASLDLCRRNVAHKYNDEHLFIPHLSFTALWPHPPLFSVLFLSSFGPVHFFVSFGSFNMFSSTSLLVTIALALSVAANPILFNQRRAGTPITLKSAKRVNATGTFNLVVRDQARAKNLKAKGANPTLAFKNAGVVGSIPATNQAVDYTVDVCHSVYISI